jgi:endonuclease/exonuclease/phosphatase family metal-dependent hydrolase
MWNCNVMTYNIMIPVSEPFRSNGQSQRTKLIPEAVKRMDDVIQGGIDVIAFQELIPSQYVNTFLENMKAVGFAYASKPLTTSYLSGKLKLANGGVIICSKHPIIAEFTSVFDTECQSADCAACKGVVYCRIKCPNNNIINIFSTHFQAWNTKKAQQIRRQQTMQCVDFINSLNIPKDEPLLFLGDLNIDFYTGQKEITELLSVLDMEMTERIEESHPFSSDPANNQMMGNDETSMYSTKLYPNGCYQEYIATLSCPCCPRELLDYILFSKRHKRPISTTSEVVILKTKKPFKMRLNVTTEREINDLSDHYPIIAKTVWKKSRHNTRHITEAPKKSEAAFWVIGILLTSFVVILIIILRVLLAQ